MHQPRRFRTRNGKEWQGSNWIKRPTRFALYHRDGWACAYCKCREAWALSLDHLDGWEAGNAPTNLVTACFDCNERKGAKKLAEFVTPREARRIRALTRRPLRRRLGRHFAELEAFFKAAGRGEVETLPEARQLSFPEPATIRTAAE